MFAVIKTGGKQYRVAAADKITVMRLPGTAGDAVTFDQVLMLTDGTTTQLGAPFVAGASVGGEIVEQARGPKVYAFKKRRRKNSKRKRGHRQDLTMVRITGFGVDGAAPVRHEPVRASEPETAVAEAHEAAAVAATPHESPPQEQPAAPAEAAGTAHEPPAHEPAAHEPVVEAAGHHDVQAHHEQAAAQQQAPEAHHEAAAEKAAPHEKPPEAPKAD